MAVNVQISVEFKTGYNLNKRIDSPSICIPE